MIIPTGEHFDHLQILSEYERIAAKYDRLGYHQFSLVHSTRPVSEDEKVLDGVGALRGKYSFLDRKESHFNQFNQEFKSWYLEEVYQRVCEWAKTPIGRMRLMRCLPHTCYSTHRDTGVRFHIALSSNPHCYFVFDDRDIIRIPVDGQLYAAVTQRWHTFVNAGETERIHLVFDEISDL